MERIDLKALLLSDKPQVWKSRITLDARVDLTLCTKYGISNQESSPTHRSLNVRDFRREQRTVYTGLVWILVFSLV